MEFLREVVANVNTGVVARWYRTSQTEHEALLQEKAGQIHIWPISTHNDKTWWGKAKKPQENCTGDFQLAQTPTGTFYISFEDHRSTPSLF